MHARLVLGDGTQGLGFHMRVPRGVVDAVGGRRARDDDAKAKGQHGDMPTLMSLLQVVP